MIYHIDADQKAIDKIFEILFDDLKCTKSEFQSSVEFWVRQVKSRAENAKLSSAIEALSICSKTFDEHVFKALKVNYIRNILIKSSRSNFPYCNNKILATLPVTTCTAERSFSTLRRLKTYLRSTMGDLRCTGLALLNIHRDIDVSVDEVVDLFRISNRRMNL